MFILSISIIICGFLLFIFERPMPDTEFDTLYNCLWVVFITISTIGYGEMVPTSHFGRVVVVVACIWGSFLLSLIVVIFQEQTQLTKEEELFYNDTVIKHDIIPVIRPYAILFIQRFFKLKQARKAKSPANPRFQLHCLESEAKDTFKRMRLAKTPSGEINIKESLKGTQDVQYKIERLRVRGENFTHGADQLLTALEFYAKEQQNAAAKYQSYCDSTVRLTNLLGSALTGKSKPVEVEDFLRIPTVSKLCRQNRLEASLRRKSSLHQIAADSQRRSVLQRNRGYERGSILVSQTLELSEFAKKIQTMEEELKNRSGSDSDVISESAFTSNIHSNAQGSLEDIELHDRNEPEAEGELRQMDRRRNQNQEDQGEDHEIDYNE